CAAHYYGSSAWFAYW
nr:immunoglobulin heavy chain junction region [Mus musculus]